MGITAFTIERPSFVKDVTEVACVCQRCLGMKLIFQGFLSFNHWDEVCPEIAEIIMDVRQIAGEFSPNVDCLLQFLMCANDPNTNFHRKTCCYGSCTQCGWAEKVGELEPQDVITGANGEHKDVFVTFSAYEKLTVPDEKDGGEEAVSKATTRPTLSKQALPPSAFLPILEAAIAEYSKHRYNPE